MNLMALVLDEKTTKDKKLHKKVNELKDLVKKEKIKINKTVKKIHNSIYCLNGLPYVPSTRDVLIKPNGVCESFKTIRIYHILVIFVAP